MVKECLYQVLRCGAIIASLAAASCSTVSLDIFNGETPRKSWNAAHVRLAESCVVSAPQGNAEGIFALLAPVVIPSIINSGLSIFSKGAKAIGERSKPKLVARTNAHFLRAYPQDGLFRSHEDLGCLIFAYGETDVGSGAAANDAGDDWSEHIAALRDVGINLSEKPKFYYEGAIKFSSDRTKFSVETQYVLYRKKVSGLSGLFGGGGDLAFTLTFSSREGEEFAHGVIALPELKAPIELRGEQAEAFSTGWMPAPGADATELGRLVMYCEQNTCYDPSQAYQRASCDSDDAVCGQPFTLKTELVESGNAAAFLASLAETIDYTASALAPEIEGSVARNLPGGLAYNPDDDARIATRQAAHVACKALQSHRLAIAAEGGLSSTQRTEMLEKIRKAEDAYRSAGLPSWSAVADSATGCVLSR